MSNTLISLEAANAKTPLSAPGRNWRRIRFIPLVIGVVAMAFGLWTGLLRIGLPLPGGTFPASELHGAFMIAGFLGTVISLERAVAHGRWWAYAAPALSAAGSLALIASAPLAGAFAFIFASIILLFATVSIALRQFAMFTIVLAIGALCWSVGTIQWLLGYAMPSVVGWWLNFLILTIAAERLELSRIVSVSRSSQVIFFFVVFLLLLGAVHGNLARSGAPLTAAGLLGLAFWLLRYDIARRTIYQHGQPGYSACAILAGHAWLAVAGIVLLSERSGAVVFSYDAAVHAIAIGFVLSMLFGHAPIILPAVTGLRVRFSRVAYVPLGLLHISVMIRVMSDLLGLMDLRAASGVLTIVALAGYAAVLTAASWRRPLPNS
jgi:hypothetical protein